MSSQRLRKEDLRPGMKVKNLRTGQIGQVAHIKTNDHFTVFVIILSHTGSKTDKTRGWKINHVALM